MQGRPVQAQDLSSTCPQIQLIPNFIFLFQCKDPFFPFACRPRHPQSLFFDPAARVTSSRVAGRHRPVSRWASNGRPIEQRICRNTQLKKEKNTKYISMHGCAFWMVFFFLKTRLPVCASRPLASAPSAEGSLAPWPALWIVATEDLRVFASTIQRPSVPDTLASRQRPWGVSRPGALWAYRALLSALLRRWDFSISRTWLGCMS